MAALTKKRKLIAEINVVPYIDVMLVLLIIFMVTAPLLTQGIKVELPKAGAEPIEDVSNQPPLVVSVDAEGNLYINVGDDEDEPATGRDIVARGLLPHPWRLIWRASGKAKWDVDAPFAPTFINLDAVRRDAKPRTPSFSANHDTH